MNLPGSEIAKGRCLLQMFGEQVKYIYICSVEHPRTCYIARIGQILGCFKHNVPVSHQLFFRFVYVETPSGKEHVVFIHLQSILFTHWDVTCIGPWVKPATQNLTDTSSMPFSRRIPICVNYLSFFWGGGGFNNGKGSKNHGVKSIGTLWFWGFWGSMLSSPNIAGFLTLKTIKNCWFPSLTSWKLELYIVHFIIIPNFLQYQD